ncbi:hypothetical protein TNCT_278701 [Trichonephila clavata]|uniref:Uncharacterized protein n=1 Tax=Trichonephila clavata TaxID=2740835 RepID=A0A8X6EXC5_TRICU|nr:hypothetical protein TNCT_278701 [Trichonephila clavata]
MVNSEDSQQLPRQKNNKKVLRLPIQHFLESTIIGMEDNNVRLGDTGLRNKFELNVELKRVREDINHVE